MVGTFEVLPLAFRSGDTSFLDWASLFTLCLTPLAMHLLAGVPAPSCLVQSRPRWHDSICLYNPTSIMWRYIAIVDRRVRAKSWSPADMAATNALFWTSWGWDGSEKMVELSLPHCRRAPRHSRIDLLSFEAIATLVVSVQGAQAVVSMFMFVRDMTLETIFYPVAVIGLGRLFPALWLTSEFEFTSLADIPMMHRKESIDSLIDREPAENRPDSRFLPTSWGSRVARTIFSLLMALLLIKSALNIIPWESSVVTVSAFFFVVYYNTLLVASFLIITYYLVRSGAKSTIVPCIASTWYKLYTGVVMACMVLMVILASVETRKSPCGLYTTLPGYLGDRTVCLAEYPNIVPVDPDPKYTVLGFGQFGLATNDTPGMPLSGSRLRGGEFLVDEFIGSCLGRFTGNARIHASTLATIAVSPAQSSAIPPDSVSP